MVRNQAAGARPASGFIHWRAPLLAALGLLAATFPASEGAADAASEAQRIWLFLGVSEDSGREGFLRVVNHSAQNGEVRIEAADDAGTSAAPVTLAIGAAQAVHLNSRDLEGGNAGKGLPEGIGPGQGDWRLTLSSDLDIEALSYVRTADGFVTTMHDTAPTMDDGSHRVAFLNPGSNHRQESHLRLVNPGADAARVRITGTDDAGQPGTAAVTAEVPAGQSRTFTAAELESGNAPGLSGALGDGAGKWRLRVESERDIVAMSLLATPTGHLANLSAPPPEADAGGAHVAPLFLSASDPLERQGFLRVVNRSDVAGTVRIEAFDQSDFAYDPVTLALDPRQARHFNSTDLEMGNANKGLAGRLGAGRGDWRLELTSDLDIEALAYIRTKDGFVTSMHDLAPTADGLLHKVAFLNPGSNDRQASHLRLVNRGAAEAEATIEGIDDAGQSPGALVRVRVPAGKAVSLGSKALEEGGDGFKGALGNGKGKWRLWVASDQPLLVASLLDTPTGHLANLSTAPGRGAAKPSSADAEAEAFRTLASPIVQSKCVTCHVEGGASGNTRLVFVTDADADHLSKNLNAFRSLLESVNDATGDGADYVLGKIQGVSHGGGVQVAAGTDEFDNMRRFLELLGGTGDRGPQSITAKNLFETVRMESPRRTLYRAAMIFAGRVPTAEELAPFPGGTMKQPKDTVRRMMTGPEFHEFLIRGANDRLLTDSLGWEDILADGHTGVIANNNYSQFSGYEAERERLQAGGRSADGGYSDEYYEWFHEVRFGARRAPLELIAHVAENDLPYTEILTADYIMANAATAGAYSAPVAFDDPDDPFEFQPTRIRGYRHGGIALDEYPHAGILNTTSYLRRYPTTPTNRNRARARWTYQHFLGVDIQNSAPTVTDADALLDTRNPTMHNPACTICHIPLDPAAGAFQNYTETGFYRATTYGKHTLDPAYAFPSHAAKGHPIEPNRPNDRTTIVSRAVPMTKDSYVFLRSRDFNRDQDLDTIATIVVGDVSLRDHDTGERYEVDLGRADSNVRFLEETGETVVYMRTNNYARVPIDVPADARYDIVAEVWAEDTGETGEFAVTAGLFREGDTWYRDMREPGFEGNVAPDADASLQWLAQRMAEDPRFAEGAVKFWWPTIMGSDITLPPASGDPEFEARLLTASAEAAEVERLARKFQSGFHAGDRPYNLKDLLAAMVLSPWFRAERNLSDDALRVAALRTAGAKRLLTPEELDRKTGALTGFKWRRWLSRNCPLLDSEVRTALTDDYALLYGGIDSETNLIRSRDVTAIMAAVGKAHAIRSSCPIVLREFYLLPEKSRRLFDGIDIDTDPGTADGELAIRRKLVELHFRFFGIEVGPDSEDVDTAFALFAETLARKQRDESAGTAFRDGNRCDTASDMLLLEGIVDPPVIVEGDGYLVEEYVRNDPDGVLDKTYEDPHHLARTWVAVLAYMMMDYRYLHL